MYKTLKEASEFLGKSEKTISRYIKRGILHPDRTKSQNGTLEYRFLTGELETLLESIEQTGQQTRQQTQQTSDTAWLHTQINRKDRQIEHLQRQIYGYITQMNTLHDKLLEYTKPETQDTKDKTSDKTSDKTPDKLIDKSRVFWLALLAAAVLLFIYVYRTQIAEILIYTKGVMAQ